MDTAQHVVPVYWFGLQKLRRHMCCRAIKTTIIDFAMIAYQSLLLRINFLDQRRIEQPVHAITHAGVRHDLRHAPQFGAGIRLVWIGVKTETRSHLRLLRAGDDRQWRRREQRRRQWSWNCERRSNDGRCSGQERHPGTGRDSSSATSGVAPDAPEDRDTGLAGTSRRRRRTRRRF